MFEKIGGIIDGNNPYGLLGSPGYTLPSDSDFDVYRIDELAARKHIPQIKIVGDVNENSGNVIIHREHDLRGVIQITCFSLARNASIIVNKHCTLYGNIAIYSSDSSVVLIGGRPEVGHSGFFSAQLWSKSNLLYIGKGSTTNGNHYVVSGEHRSIIVADDCMFASGISLRTDDQHPIIDLETGIKQNPPNDIVLEPHVWLGQGVFVSKGAVLGLGSVVGAGSLVLKSTRRFSVNGGVPAKELASGRTWTRKAMPPLDAVEHFKQMAASVPPFELKP
jgi:acetyltransferase-like isoleucine patch superfamily enzyme